METNAPLIRWFAQTSAADVPLVGGKNASLGELTSKLAGSGIRVPDGFAVTAAGYWRLLEDNALRGRIAAELRALKRSGKPLSAVGRAIRRLVEAATFPSELATALVAAYRELCTRCGLEDLEVAVRSSATAEDLPQASFAGQQESFLNVAGERALLEACRHCYASLFTDRAISYREQKGFDHMSVALSIGVQRMVHADAGGAGVMFTLDPDTGFPGVVVINAVWGYGENLVQGIVTPDEYRVFKPLLGRADARPILSKTLGDKPIRMVGAHGGGQRTRNVPTTPQQRRSFVLEDEQILRLARWACRIEEHYGRPMDVEWVLDGATGELFIVQARPETVQSRRQPASLKTYELKGAGELLLEGLAIGGAIAAGKVCVLRDPREADRFDDGGILVTEMTDPDWVPLMKRAAGIVTDHGGRTSHAAIVSRELGVPAVIGTGRATGTLESGQEVTLSCAGGGETGRVYRGILPFEASELDLTDVPATKTQVMMNIASPEAAFRWWRMPCDGVGLARIEFIINNSIRVHPLALTRPDQVRDSRERREIERLTRGYADRTTYFVEKLAQGIATIAASRHPDPVIVRFSDFKTNEYAGLLGGSAFEPREANPMLGFRGASRYYSDRYRDGFALECQAIRRVREEIGLDNVVVMIPFCRTLEEADRALGVMAEQGLTRGERGLEVYVMAEIPSNVILAERFAQRFDGFSIGSNDLTQLVLGVDRDAEDLAHLFDERNEAVKRMIRDLIAAAHKQGRKVGICGQAPSDHPDFAAFLVEAGIDSISLNPDRVVSVKRLVARIEGEAKPEHQVPRELAATGV